MNPFKPHARVGTYFGCVGYNNLKAEVVKSRFVCPCCGSPCGELEHKGSKDIVTDPKHPDFRRKGFEEPFDDGVRAWVPKEFDEEI
jgi:hypothetical protein